MNKEIIENDVCDCNVIHDDLVNIAKEKMPSDKVISDLSELFKVLGDPTRVKILQSLILSEMCVCDIAQTLNMTHSAVSHQLRVLRSARLVTNRKVGKVVYYSLDDDHVLELFTQGLKHVEE